MDRKRKTVYILQQLVECGRELAAEYYSSTKTFLFGHVKRHDSLERTIFEGFMEGKRGERQTKKKVESGYH